MKNGRKSEIPKIMKTTETITIKERERMAIIITMAIMEKTATTETTETIGIMTTMVIMEKM